jgi:hypothetical protein
MLLKTRQNVTSKPSESRFMSVGPVRGFVAAAIVAL